MDLFNLSAKLTLDSDEYNEGLDKAKNKAGGLSKALGTFFKAGAAAVGVASTAVGVLGGQAVKAYANYEQLIGGVEKLYGAAAGKLEQYAKEAYKTAGMSANEYMETATSFSASLIKSLGGDMDKAADMTDVAMRAISDNVNMFGSDMESVSNAFKGFAKNNFTMLDNLKLGYAGSKEGMEQLIKDANDYRKSMGLSADLTIDSFADMVQAVQTMQEKLGVAGTTQKEAMKTLEGSANATKAAWQNVITAIGKGTGMNQAANGLITAIFGDENGGGLLSNLIPRFKTVLEGIGTFLEKSAPIFIERVPVIIRQLVPELLKGAMSLLKTLGKTIGAMLPSLIKILLGMVPELVKTGLELIKGLATGISKNLKVLVSAAIEIIQQIANSLVESLPELVPAVMEVLLQIVATLTDPTMLSQLVDAAIAIMVALANGLVQALPTLIEQAPTIITNLVTAIVENVPKLMEAAWEVIKTLVNGILENLPEIGTAAGQIVAKLGEGLATLFFDMYEVGANIIGGLVQGIQNKWEWLKEQAAKFFENFIGAIKDFFGIHSPSTVFAEIGNFLIQGLINGLKDKWDKLKSKVVEIATSIRDKFTEKFAKAKEWGADMIKNFTDGIKSKWESLKSTVSNVAQSIKNFLGFSEPKEGPLSNFHTYAPDMMQLFAKGIKDNEHLVTDQIKKSFDFGEQVVPVKTNVAGTIANTSGSGNTTWNININQPIASPDEIANTLRVEAQYGLIGGVGLGQS